jgi:hypothetical protein
MEGKFVTEKDLSVSGYPGREAVFEMTAGGMKFKATARMTLMAKIGYVALSGYRESDVKPSDNTKFLDSFTINK